MNPELLKVVVFNSEARSRNNYIVASIARGFRSEGCDVKLLRYGNLIRECCSWRPDVLVAVGGSGTNLSLLYPALSEVGCSVLWTSEDPYELQSNISVSRYFDLVFSNDEGCASSYKKGLFLPFAADAALHLIAPKRSKDCLFDLFFVGTAWPERVQTLNKLLRALPPGLSIKVGLSGNPSLPNFHLGDLNLLTNFRLSPHEFSSMANLSKVTLTLDRAFSTAGGSQRGLTPPPRLFELAAAGTAQVYLTDGRDTRNFFPPEVLVTARDEQDAADAIVRLVDDPDRRDHAAQSAYSTAVDKHLYNHRVRAILDEVGKQRVHRPIKGSALRRKPRILYVTHNIEGVHPFGGVETYQKSAIQALPGF